MHTYISKNTSPNKTKIHFLNMHFQHKHIFFLYEKINEQKTKIIINIHLQSTQLLRRCSAQTCLLQCSHTFRAFRFFLRGQKSQRPRGPSTLCTTFSSSHFRICLIELLISRGKAAIHYLSFSLGVPLPETMPVP